MELILSIISWLIADSTILVGTRCGTILITACDS